MIERICIWLARQLPRREILKMVDGEPTLYLARYYVWPRVKATPGMTPAEVSKAVENKDKKGRNRFRLYLHLLALPDQDLGPHDHPWSFWSTALTGSYDEDYAWRQRGRGLIRGSRRRRRFIPAFVPSRDFYHQVRLPRGPVWTLVLAGRRRPDSWGFLIDGRFIAWDDSDFGPGGTETLVNFVPPEGSS